MLCANKPDWQTTARQVLSDNIARLPRSAILSLLQYPSLCTLLKEVPALWAVLEKDPDLFWALLQAMEPTLLHPYSEIVPCPQEVLTIPLSAVTVSRLLSGSRYFRAIAGFDSLAKALAEFWLVSERGLSEHAATWLQEKLYRLTEPQILAQMIWALLFNAKTFAALKAEDPNRRLWLLERLSETLENNNFEFMEWLQISEPLLALLLEFPEENASILRETLARALIERLLAREVQFHLRSAEALCPWIHFLIFELGWGREKLSHYPLLFWQGAFDLFLKRLPTSVGSLEYLVSQDLADLFFLLGVMAEHPATVVFIADRLIEGHALFFSQSILKQDDPSKRQALLAHMLERSCYRALLGPMRSDLLAEMMLLDAPSSVAEAQIVDLTAPRTARSKNTQDPKVLQLIPAVNPPTQKRSVVSSTLADDPLWIQWEFDRQSLEQILSGDETVVVAGKRMGYKKFYQILVMKYHPDKKP